MRDKSHQEWLDGLQPGDDVYIETRGFGTEYSYEKGKYLRRTPKTHHLIVESQSGQLLKFWSSCGDQIHYGGGTLRQATSELEQTIKRNRQISISKRLIFDFYDDRNHLKNEGDWFVVAKAIRETEWYGDRKAKQKAEADSESGKDSKLG